MTEELDDDALDLSKVLTDEELKAVPDENKLKRLSKLCSDQIRIQEELEELEKQLVAKKQELAGVSEVAIPDLFDELGIDEFRLKSGVRVSVEPFFSGKITGPECYDWLEDNEHGDIIKGKLTIPYPRDFDQSKLRAISKAAEELGLLADNEVSVHHSTLKAWIKDMITRGEEFPREMFNVYVGRKTRLSIR